MRALMRHPRLDGLREFAFFLRGALFVGRRYQCPCCGWRLRAFTVRSGIFAGSDTGYCPRCNAKARHRRLWLYLEQRTKLFGSPGTDLLEVAPWWSLSRRLRRMRTLRHVGLDLEPAHAGVSVVGNLVALPFRSGSFDALLCTHVLEHVGDDRRAIDELRRVLKPDGWAIVSVPIRLDRPTHEDATVTDPEERRRLFGERGHVRFYGTDFRARLQSVGFLVDEDAPGNIPPSVRRRHGLRDDEHLFHCRLAGEEA